MAICGLAPAQAQQTPQIGLYIDDTRSGHCAYGTDYYPVDVYVWARPGDNGMKAMVFQILYPDNMIPAYLVFNEAIVLGNNGTPQNGISVVFDDCLENDWFWGLYQTVLITSEDSGLVQLFPAQRFFYSQLVEFGISNCNSYPDVTFDAAVPVSNVGLNFCPDDVTPPFLADLRVIDHSTLEITFTEEVTAESAEDIGNYLVYSRYIEEDSIFPVSAELFIGDTTVALVFAEPLGCYQHKIFRSLYVADSTGNMWDLAEPFTDTTSFADLTVFESIFKDTLAGCGDEIIVSCTIMNIGHCPSSPSRVHLYYDGLTEGGAFLGTTDFGYEVFPGLEAGDIAVVQFDGFDSCVKNHTLRAHGNIRLRVDPDDEVDESNEDNNEYESPLVVLPPRSVTYELVGDTVRAEFGRSPFDKADIPEPVTSYEILWSAGWSGEYEIAAVVPADGSLEYTCEFPMTNDRDFSVVYTRAVRPAGATTYYYDNCREWHETGTDLPPAAPTGFTANPVDDDMYLEWEANIDEDIIFYILEWSETGEFPPVSDPPGYPYGEQVHVTFFTHDGWDPGDILIYRLCAADSAGNCGGYAFANSWGQPTDDSVVPELSLTLCQNHPNPFNPSTTIRFYLPERSPVRLEVFDVSGRRTACLIEDYMDKGSHAAEWNGNDLIGNAAASGVYFYRLTAGRKTISKKMILLR